MFPDATPPRRQIRRYVWQPVSEVVLECGDLCGDVGDPSLDLAGSGAVLRGETSWDGGATFSGEETHAPILRVPHKYQTGAVGGTQTSVCPTA